MAMDKDKRNSVVGQVPEKLSQRRKVPKLPLIIIAVLIGLGGAYAVIHSLAASDPDLLFNGTDVGDYLEQAAMTNPPPGVAAADHNAISQVTDPLGSGEQVFKYEVHNDDVTPKTPTVNPRAQLVGPSNINLGDDVWLENKFMLPSDFPSNVPGWMALFATYGPPFDGSGAWGVEVSGSQIQWQRNDTYGYDVPWSIPLVKNQWIDVLVHEKFDANGFIEMWVNGKQVTFFDKSSTNYLNPNNVAPTTHLTMQTADHTNNGGANSGRVMQYQELNMFTNPVTTYHGPLIVGKTQAAVQAAAAADAGSSSSTPPPPAADTTAPSVSVTTPSANATVSGSSATVSANASDNIGVAGVQFKLDGANLGSEDTTAPYTSAWDTTKTTNGTHTLTAVARDAAGNTTTSSSVTVTVNNSNSSCTKTVSPGDASTVQSAMQTMAPGQTLCLHGGTYSGNVAVTVPAGTSTSPIIMKAYPGERPIIQGLFWITSPTYWTFDGINVTWNSSTSTAGDHMLKLTNGHDWTWENSEVWGAHSFADMLVAGTTSGQPYNWQVTNNCIHDTYPTNSTNEDHNIYANTGTTAGAGSIDHNLIFNATNGENIKVAGASSGQGSNNITIDHNTLYNAAQNILVGWATSSTRITNNIADLAGSTYGNVRGYELTGTNNVAQDNAGYQAASFILNYDGGNGVTDGGGNQFQQNPNFSSTTCGDFTNGEWTGFASSLPYGYHASSTGTGTTPPAPDTTKPTVSFSSPANNAAVSGIVTATATASDNVGVSRVDFSVDGAATPALSDTSAPYNYSFDSKTLGNGSHTITAKAYDAAGNTASSTVTVTINNPDTTPPSVPANVKASATNATTVNLTWNASTDSGTNATGVAKYNVLRNGIVIAQLTGTSYTDLAAIASTAYSYTVQAVDAAGNVSANSSTANVTTPAATTTNQDLLFDGTKISDYENQSAPGAITEVPDPVGGSQTVFKMVVNNTDVAPITPTDNPRAQLVGPNILTNGEDFWWSSKVLLPSDFPSSVPTGGWFNLLEGAYGPPFDGSPPWEFEISGSQFAWQRNSTYGYDVPYLGPQIVKNQWVSVMVHEKLATNGFIEMWVNGQPVTFFPTGGSNYNPNKVSPTTQLNMQTWDSSNNGGNNFEVLQSYRKVNMFNNAVTIYEWPMKMGTTEASVNNDSNSSTPTTPQPDTTPPSTPSGLKATAPSSTQINLTWNASTDSGGSGLAGYNIYRDGSKLNSSLVTSTSYGDSTLDASTTYTYKIEAVDGAGNKSTQSSGATVTTPVAPDTTPPSTPSGLKATAPSSTQINLTWNASTDSGGSGLAGYNIYRDGSKLNTAPLSGTAYDDASAAAGTTYKYAVQAIDKAGNLSAKTSTVNIITPAAPVGSGSGTGSTGQGGSGASTGTGPSGGSSSGTGTTAPVIITVLGHHGHPVAGATVTIDGQTAQTNSRGVASFAKVPTGKQPVSIKSGMTAVTRSVKVSSATSSHHHTAPTRPITVSLTNANLSPALLLVPVMALVAGGLIIFRPWNNRLSRVAVAAPEAPPIVSSSHPETDGAKPGHKFDAPGTIYEPNNHDDKKS
jgi:fibronectin type 3 domain-containing protein